MPAKSKKQFKFMQGVAHGNIKDKSLSEEKAKEFVEGVDYSALPAKAKKKAPVRPKKGHKPVGKGKRSGPAKKGQQRAISPEIGYSTYGSY